MPRSDGLTAAVRPRYFHGLPALMQRHSGMADLMRAMLADALDCVHLSTGSTTRTRRLAHEAQAGFRSDNERWPCAFLQVCYALDLASVRRTLQQGNDPGTPVASRPSRSMAPRRCWLHGATPCFAAAGCSLSNDACVSPVDKSVPAPSLAPRCMPGRALTFTVAGVSLVAKLLHGHHSSWTKNGD
jgi:hypothetical protein